MTFEIHNVGTVLGGEAFLLVTEQSTALIDSGFAFGAKGLVKNIAKILDGRPLDYILLTHSHYDHVSGAQECRRHWPDAKIVSAEHAAKVFQKPSAIKTMMKLNRSAARNTHHFPIFKDNISGISTDMIVKDGDVIDLGDMKLEVLETPGHTWDTIAFWSAKEKLLVSNETIGVAVDIDNVTPACLVSFKKAVESIERVRALAPESIVMPHYGVVSGSDVCAKYLESAYAGHMSYKDMILEAYDGGMEGDDLLKYSKDRLWVGPIRIGQPEAAFDLNNKYIVPTIVKEFRQ
ncbi:MBL fold metallo-hydrolase [Candidatus Methanarcanum hacksteinii]|uniref:MBL fold metallo-hydrolase n=1 Tax=Candidatus Methanarcanum hacksteinii TaxID=2911857 RepID=UPI0037DD12E5